MQNQKIKDLKHDTLTLNLLIAPYIKLTLSLFEVNDINMINLECALTDSDGHIAKACPAMKAP